jgi:putative transposase
VFTLSELCRTLDVTPSGFYAWRQRPESVHTQGDRRLRVLLRASFETSRQRYGSPRVHEDLLEQQIHVSRKRVVRLMQEERLQARVQPSIEFFTLPND